MGKQMSKGISFICRVSIVGGNGVEGKVRGEGRSHPFPCILTLSTLRYPQQTECS